MTTLMHVAGRAKEDSTLYPLLNAIMQIDLQRSGAMNFRRNYGRLRFIMGLTCVLLAGSLISRNAYAASPTFTLKRIELVFQNGRTDIVVPRRFPNLRVYATLQFSRTGLLRATWKVDGMAIGQIVDLVAFGETVMLANGPNVTLPTTNPGQHTVTLDIENPKSSFRLPRITYFVTAEEYEDFQKHKGIK